MDANLLAFRDHYICVSGSQTETRRYFGIITMIAVGLAQPTTLRGITVSGLSILFDTQRRVPLGIFLGKVQELHHEIRQRVRQLQQGALPTARRQST